MKTIIGKAHIHTHFHMYKYEHTQSYETTYACASVCIVVLAMIIFLWKRMRFRELEFVWMFSKTSFWKNRKLCTFTHTHTHTLACKHTLKSFKRIWITSAQTLPSPPSLQSRSANTFQHIRYYPDVWLCVYVL